MAITYVNDLRLSEMGTGDNSGTWGTVTNTNLELIGEALGFGTEAITTNADTHASTIADGSTDPVRAMYVKYTGTLDSACTITIGPNTVNKFYYIENATSGSQNIIISQGSGANVTIPPGDVKAVYLDGAGSGAAVTDAFASLSVVDLKVQDDLTVTDDMTVGGTLGVTGVLTTTAQAVLNGGFAAVQESTVLIADGQADNAYAFQIKNEESTDDRSYGLLIHAGSTATDRALAINTHDGNAALFYVQGNGQALFTDGTVSLPSITNNGDVNTGIFFPAADTLALTSGAVEAIRMTGSGGITVNNAQNTNVNFVVKAGSSANALQVDGSSGAVTINEAGADADFRVESDGNANMLFVDAGNNCVNIGTTTNYGGEVNIETAGNATNLALVCTDADENRGPILDLSRNNSSAANGDQVGCILFNADDDANNQTEYASITGFISSASNTAESGGLIFDTATNSNTTVEKLRLGPNEAVFNEGSADIDFRIESNANIYGFMLDAGTGHAGFNAAAASNVGLHVRATATNASTYVFETANAAGASRFLSRSDGYAVFYDNDNNNIIDIGLTASGTTFNASGVARDFLIETEGVSHMFFIDDSADTIAIGTTNMNTAGNNVAGTNLLADGMIGTTRDGGTCIKINRKQDGDLVEFRSAAGIEGTISISGSTTSYNGFSGLHESSGIPTNTPVGTVVSTIDELDVYPSTQGSGNEQEPNPKAGQTRADHAKVKVSDTAGDACVYGVVGSFNEQDKVNVTSVGIGSVRVTGACAKGDLLESNGDGTAKVQSDDIVRSKTLGKVTIGNSNTGVKLVSCVMYCG